MAVETYQGSCHCGDVKFEADLDLEAGTNKCNCSMCAKSRLWAIVIKPEAFRLLTPPSALSDYVFGYNSIHHKFCKRCGVRPFDDGHVKGLGGDFVGVNIACLDGVSDEALAALPVVFVNGRNDDWEHVPSVTSHL
jgi:hypothetical protein